MCFISLGTLAVKIFLRSIKLLCSVSINNYLSIIGKNSKKGNGNGFFRPKIASKWVKTAFINNLSDVIPEYVNKVVNNLPTKLSTIVVENFMWEKVL
jgi:hypothetical protein